MSAMADLDYQIQSSILRNYEQVTELCEQLAAGYRAAFDTENAAYFAQAARRYRQAAEAAPAAWADADRLDALRANSAADTSAADAETLACTTREMPRVH